MEPLTIHTIGYEGAAPSDFWATLAACGIQTLIDVRDVPMSRKTGFSKRALAAEADIQGVRYIHLGGLGDPKPGREAARAGKLDRFRAIFSDHMRSPEAQSDLSVALDLARDGRVCLLCYERDPEHCHRSIVASHMIGAGVGKPIHLGVRAGLALSAPRGRGHHGIGELGFGRV